MKIRSNAKQVLFENYKQTSQDITFPEYVRIESENDPNFWYWFFDTDDADSGCPDLEAFEAFMKDISICSIKCYKSGADLFAFGNYYDISFEDLTFENEAEFDEWAGEVLEPCKGCENYDDIKMSLYIHLSHKIA